MADDASTENILVAEEGEEATEGDDLHEDAEVDTNGGAEGASEEATAEDPELEAIKQRVKEMEEEAEKLKEMQNQVEKQIMSPSAGTPSGAQLPSWEEKQDADGRSVYVGNVDYGATAEELESHFHGCGAVNRVTILCDKFSGHPKGFAYIEFAEKDAVSAAVALDDSLFRGRQIKVSSKRTNRPGISSTNRGGRSRGRRPYRHFYQPYYTPRFRGRYRRRASSWHAY